MLEARQNKLSLWRSQGRAFPNNFQPDARIQALIKQYHDAEDEDWEQTPQFKLAGRIMRKRMMGKAGFFTLKDQSGNLQIYLRQNDLSTDKPTAQTLYQEFKDSDIGDIVGVSGQLMRTQTGELTLRANQFTLLSKSLRPLPDKHKGLADLQTRARRRYLDLLLNQNQIALFRSGMNTAVRQFLDSRDYLEVETPMMHPIPGGANALPFITHHNSLGQDLYLRVAPELYLKTLLVGGLERIYELNRNFRNEGVSTRHNPEFTMLEFYCAWANWHYGMEQTEQLLRATALQVTAHDQLDCSNHQTSEQLEDATVSFQLPFRRISMVESVAQALHTDWQQLTDPQTLIQLARKTPEVQEEASAWNPNTDWGFMINRLFEKKVERHLWQPTFVTHYPLSISPLARACTDAPESVGGMHPIAERWELIITGKELAGGFSELNDPEEQRKRFELQTQLRESGNEEAMHYDTDFIEALEYGMPPATGVGIGLDRLLMLLTNSASIREVILFPQVRQ
ncbi:MAG: lysine--tRNA ligase [Gammaproteobacteria bacterium]